MRLTHTTSIKASSSFQLKHPVNLCFSLAISPKISPSAGGKEADRKQGKPSGKCSGPSRYLAMSGGPRLSPGSPEQSSEAHGPAPWDGVHKAFGGVWFCFRGQTWQCLGFSDKGVK